MADARARETIMGVSSKTSVLYQMLALSNRLLDTKFKIILGYEQNRVISIERGEIEGSASTVQNYPGIAPHWNLDKDINILTVNADKRLPRFPNAPTMSELTDNPVSKQMLEFMMLQSATARAIFAPPGVPQDRLQALRRAFDETARDPGFIADMKRAQIEVEPSTGEETQAAVGRLIGTSPEVAAMVLDAVQIAATRLPSSSEHSMVKPIRRIVAGNDDRGIAVALSDGPSPDVRLDPARPGFALTRLWVQETTPARAKGLRETLHLPHTLEPPRNGSICRAVEYPPEAATSAGSAGRCRGLFRRRRLARRRDGDGRRAASLHAAHVFARLLLHPRRRDHARARHRRGASQGWGSGDPARHQPRLEQPLRQALHHHDVAARRLAVAPGTEPPIEAGKAVDPDAKVRPLRRVVTGHDAQGRSGVAFDIATCRTIFRASPAPASTNYGRSRTCRSDLPATPMPAPPGGRSCIRRR